MTKRSTSTHTISKRTTSQRCRKGSFSQTHALEEYITWLRSGSALLSIENHVSRRSPSDTILECANKFSHKTANSFVDAPEVALSTMGPPKNAEFLLYLILPRERRNEVCGDVSQQYHFIATNFGRRKAHLFLYKEVLFSITHEVSKLFPGKKLWVWIAESFQRLIC